MRARCAALPNLAKCLRRANANASGQPDVVRGLGFEREFCRRPLLTLLRFRKHVVLWIACFLLFWWAGLVEGHRVSLLRETLTVYDD